MRTIKFRAIGINGDGTGILYFTLEQLIHHQINTQWLADNPGIKQDQFTGLKDKNGKEIYEGDILAWKSEYSDKVDQTTVFWDAELAGFNWKMPGLNFNKGGIRHFEVIGNIYENPELINK